MGTTINMVQKITTHRTKVVCSKRVQIFRIWISSTTSYFRLQLKETLFRMLTISGNVRCFLPADLQWSIEMSSSNSKSQTSIAMKNQKQDMEWVSTVILNHQSKSLCLDNKKHLIDTLNWESKASTTTKAWDNKWLKRLRTCWRNNLMLAQTRSTHLCYQVQSNVFKTAQLLPM